MASQEQALDSFDINNINDEKLMDETVAMERGISIMSRLRKTTLEQSQSQWEFSEEAYRRSIARSHENMPEDTDYLSHLLSDILGNWKICAESYSLLYSQFQQHGITQERTILEDHFRELSQQQEAAQHQVLQAKTALSKPPLIHASCHSIISSHRSSKSEIDQQLAAMDATLAYENEQAQIQEEIKARQEEEEWRKFKKRQEIQCKEREDARRLQQLAQEKERARLVALRGGSTSLLVANLSSVLKLLFSNPQCSW